jgi:hypothetical protein
MAKVIIIQGGSLESYYEQTMDYLHNKYHNQPSDLPPDTRTVQQKFNDSCEESHARRIASGVRGERVDARTVSRRDQGDIGRKTF